MPSDGDTNNVDLTLGKSTFSLFSIYSSSTSLFVRHPLWAVLMCIFVTALIFATVVGNCMVCFAVLMVRKLKQQPVNLLLVSLAVADCSVGIFVMPIALVNVLEDQWVLGILFEQKFF